MIETHRYILEDKIDHYRMLTSIAPLARTAMDKKSGDSLNKYAKSLDQSLDAMTPWRGDRAAAGKSASLRRNKKIKPGEIVVILDGADKPNDPLFSGAKITRE